MSKSSHALMRDLTADLLFLHDDENLLPMPSLDFAESSRKRVLDPW